MDRIERIGAMEALLNASTAAVERFEEALGAYAKAQKDIRRLTAYYGSRTWYADRAADEKGRLPDDLPRGVLSEDLIYDVITNNRENALQMLEQAADILRNL